MKLFSIYISMLFCYFVTIDLNAQHRLDLNRANDYVDSLDLFATIAKSSTDSLFLADFYFLLSSRAETRDIHAINQVDYLEKSKQFYHSQNDLYGYHRCIYQLSIIALNNERFEVSKNYLLECKNYFEGIQDTEALTHVYSCLSRYYGSSQQQEKQLLYLDSAFVFSKDSFLLNIIRFQRAELLFSSGSYLEVVWNRINW